MLPPYRLRRLENDGSYPDVGYAVTPPASDTPYGYVLRDRDGRHWRAEDVSGEMVAITLRRSNAIALLLATFVS